MLIDSTGYFVHEPDAARSGSASRPKPIDLRAGHTVCWLSTPPKISISAAAVVLTVGGAAIDAVPRASVSVAKDTEVAEHRIAPRPTPGRRAGRYLPNRCRLASWP